MTVCTEKVTLIQLLLYFLRPPMLTLAEGEVLLIRVSVVEIEGTWVSIVATTDARAPFVFYTLLLESSLTLDCFLV